ncbi:MAG: hypothetical protein ACRETN_08330 [Nevskiales bacterium]
MRCALMVLAATGLLLVGCKSDSDDGFSPGSSSGGGARATAVAPQAATGAECAGVHGDPPRPAGPSLVGTLANLYPVELLCPLRGGELLTWTDPLGTPREACLHTPANASAQTPLPLLTFLGGSLFPGDPQTIINGMEFLIGTADLSGDPARPGFSFLVIEGRDKQHFYPFPDDHAWGFDNWYRNFDRKDPALNVDVATIDHFIHEVQARGVVDAQRLYLSGHSNGAAMAIIYGLNTPGIAAMSVYSSPDPFRDIGDPCPQAPFGNNLRPVMTIHNDCDIGGICQTGSENFSATMAQSMPQVEYERVLIDLQQGEATQCDASCSYDGDPTQLLTLGSLRHLLWPTQWTGRMLEFMRDRPLPN